MRRFSQSLLADMEQQLKTFHTQTDNPLLLSKQAVTYLITILEKLKAFCTEYTFQSEAEEIEFFREIKPQFMARFIYYSEIYTLEINKPLGTKKDIRRHYKSELAKLRSFFSDNLEFYRYYRADNRELDAHYFLRARYDMKFSLDSAYLHADTIFSTTHDYKVAKIIANSDLQEYLDALITGTASRVAIQRSRLAQWTAPKVALVELVYALHAAGVFNNGTSELKEVAETIGRAFGINLGHYHKTFLEIRQRRSERTKFISGLQQALIFRMDQADEI